jgi:hypothetical protein
MKCDLRGRCFGWCCKADAKSEEHMDNEAEKELQRKLAAIPAEELISHVTEINAQIHESGGKLGIDMNTPPSRYDSDLLVGELIRRYAASQGCISSIYQGMTL